MGTTLRVVGKSEVSESQPAQVSEAELTRAENELRQEARSLVREIDHKYWDLGRVLYDVYDGVPGGYRALMSGKGSATERQELFKKWGYTSFGEWVEQEVNLRTRTAMNLRYAYYWFAVAQQLPDEIIEDLISIGRSKVYQLAGVADKTNITLWIERAKNLTHDKLKTAIAEAKAVSAGKSDKAAKEGGGEVDDDSDTGPQVESKTLPKPEELSTFQAGLYEGQKKTVDMAFERAMGVTKSEKKGHNLELICQDYLSNNDFDDPKKDIDKYISKMEKRLGLLMIAIDPQTGKPVHGQDLLWRLIEESKKGDEG